MRVRTRAPVVVMWRVYQSAGSESRPGLRFFPRGAAGTSRESNKERTKELQSLAALSQPTTSTPTHPHPLHQHHALLFSSVSSCTSTTHTRLQQYEFVIYLIVQAYNPISLVLVSILACLHCSHTQTHTLDCVRVYATRVGDDDRHCSLLPHRHTHTHTPLANISYSMRLLIS